MIDRENMCNYVSSHGILRSCDFYGSPIKTCTKELMGYDFPALTTNGTILHICSLAMHQFIKSEFICQINCNFILVTGDSDVTVPCDLFSSTEQFNKFIENPKIIHWFSQNCSGKHAKLTQIPIGLDYHTLARSNTMSWGPQMPPLNQEQSLDLIKLSSKPFWEREYRCYSNFHHRMYEIFSNPRKKAIEQLPKHLVYYEPNKIKRQETWEKQAMYAFVISPHGYGLDCHRTWEALCLGCIVIVKKSSDKGLDKQSDKQLDNGMGNECSSLDKMYADLPVLIVDQWTDINQELLDRTINDFRTIEFKYEKLTLKYWVDMIKNARSN